MTILFWLLVGAFGFTLIRGLYAEQARDEAQIDALHYQTLYESAMKALDALRAQIDRDELAARYRRGPDARHMPNAVLDRIRDEINSAIDEDEVSARRHAREAASHHTNGSAS